MQHGTAGIQSYPEEYDVNNLYISYKVQQRGKLSIRYFIYTNPARPSLYPIRMHIGHRIIAPVSLLSYMNHTSQQLRP